MKRLIETIKNLNNLKSSELHRALIWKISQETLKKIKINSYNKSLK